MSVSFNAGLGLDRVVKMAVIKLPATLHRVIATCFF